MRSLYTDDIKGTRSRITIFDKSIFKQRYSQFARSNEKNPQHQKYQWYMSPRKNQNNKQEQYRQPRYSLKLMSEHEGLSRSVHFQQLKKITQASREQKIKPTNNSMISNSGRYSVGQLNNKKISVNNPYFPHRYEENQSKIKWTGNRQWTYDKRQKISLPEITKSKFFTYI